MLILARRVNQSVMIGDDIEVKIVHLQGGQVKIAIDAPREVSVIRKELLERDSPSTQHERAQPKAEVRVNRPRKPVISLNR